MEVETTSEIRIFTVFRSTEGEEVLGKREGETRDHRSIPTGRLTEGMEI